MALSSSAAARPLRNPGPSWGYDFLRRVDRAMPRRIMRGLLAIGAGVAVCAMPVQRRHSRTYLSTLFGRPARSREVWRHFNTYAEVLIARIRAAETGVHHCRPERGFEAFRALMSSDRPALLGTFHFGNSDLLGFLLGAFERHVYMIRLRVGNSRDTHRLADTFGQWVSYIWVNQSDNLLFALKNAAQSGGSIAMMCDRPEYSSKLEPFQFLGARRLMPFTIYHLSLVFHMPVIFCLSVPGAADESQLHASPVFEPDPAASKDANLQRARIHFQAFLAQLETLLHERPYLWFNFLPLSPALPVPTPPPNSATGRPAISAAC